MEMADEEAAMKRVLKRGVLACPKPCRTALHFEVMGGMRIVRNGYLNARCPECKEEFLVTPNEDHSK